MERNIDVISLVKLYVVEGKVVRHEDWYAFNWTLLSLYPSNKIYNIVLEIQIPLSSMSYFLDILDQTLNRVTYCHWILIQHHLYRNIQGENGNHVIRSRSRRRLFHNYLQDFLKDFLNLSFNSQISVLSFYHLNHLFFRKLIMFVSK